ncbi:MAG: T9SS type A sorting domain-containing protein [Dyadobacter sp.]|uniref:T9SS type A sorting domain-containing protein n=1 Tax=Dyadobacter sp. TaxID=1914288 RepID=UPI003267156F
MKTLSTLICLTLWGFASPAQNIQLDYDAGGNRILRKPSVGLPVTLVSFTAEKSVSSVMSGSADNSPEVEFALLRWQTAAEINSDRFEVQRSQEGKKWFRIGSVNAQGDKTSDTYYSFTDHTPAEGANLYRLKMIDKDETFAYSRIRDLHFESGILAYPNPVGNMLNLKGSGLQTVQIFNNTGRLVYETSQNISKINVSALAAGSYILKLIRNNGSNVIRNIVKD